MRALALLPVLIAPAMAVADGALDTSFGIQGRYVFAGETYDEVGALLLQSDDRLVAWNTRRITAECYGLVGKRLDANATAVDPTFGTDGSAAACFRPLMPPGQTVTFSYTVDAVKVPGGMVVLGFGYDGDLVPHLQLAKFSDGGTLDPSFGSAGLVCFDCNPGSPLPEEPAALRRRGSDGALVVVGHTHDRARLWAFTSAGAPIAQFTDSGFQESRFRGLAVAADGKIVAVGYARTASTDDYDCLVERFVLRGDQIALDTTFNGSGRVVVGFDLGDFKEDFCGGVAVYPDGRIFIAGTSAQFFGASRVATARLTATGALDTTYAGSGRFTTFFETRGNNYAQGAPLLGNGRLLVGGSGATQNFERDYDLGVIRLTATGGLDGSFVGTTPGSTFATAMVGFEPIVGDSSYDAYSTMLLQNGNLVLFGRSRGNVAVVARLVNDLLFADRFE